MGDSAVVEQFWQEYLDMLPADLPPPAMPQAWSFGDNAALAGLLDGRSLAGDLGCLSSLDLQEVSP